MNKDRIAKKILFIVVLITLIWLIISITVRLNVNEIVFHPLKRYYSYPGIPQYTQYFTVNSQNQKIDLKYYQGQKPGKIVLYFYGNGGFSTIYLKDLIQQGNILVPNYPGYLESEGKPTIDNFYEIGDIAYQKALDLGYREDQIIIWGHSLGGSVAAYISSKNPNLNKTILVNTFNNLENECEKRFYIFCIFGQGLLPSEEYATKIQGKVRQFHYKYNTTVPLDLGQKLYESVSSDDKKFTILEIGDHNNFDIPKIFED